ncbi:MAG: hypothetical protein HY613_08735 [Candidatus Rokubacteria bacterium]|nr:hypothetical protein [Candidatus Rokubacteria bacterium]
MFSDMVAAAHTRGTPVEYIVFDNEGHGFKIKANQLRGYRAILEFLDRHLRGVETPAATASTPSEGFRGGPGTARPWVSPPDRRRSRAAPVSGCSCACPCACAIRLKYGAGSS